jgi:hypothetical protein
MSLISLLVNEWLPTALFGVACCDALETETCGGLTDGKGLALAIPFFSSSSFSLPYLLAEDFFLREVW